MLAKIKLGYLRLLAQIPKKTSNLRPQVEKVSLLKELVSTEAEGTAKKVWSVVKPNAFSTPHLEPQNPSSLILRMLLAGLR